MSKKATEPEDEFDAAAVAQQIGKIEDALSRIERGGLNRRAIVALIQDQTKIGKRTIENVLYALVQLRTRYIATAPPIPKRKTAGKKSK